MTSRKLFINVLVLHLLSGGVFAYPRTWSSVCPRMYKKEFRGNIPQGNLTAGVYKVIDGVTTLKQCVFECCQAEKCNVAFMKAEVCFHLTCKSNELCIPVPGPNPELIDSIAMVLVKPTDDDTWEDVLSQREFSKEQQMDAFGELYKDLVMYDTTNYGTLACEVGSSICTGPNEQCTANGPKSRAGTCRCQEGFIRNQEGDCLLSLGDKQLRLLTDHVLDLESTSTNPNNLTKAITRQELKILVESKEVRLPQNEVTLEAHIQDMPASEEGKYQFLFDLLHQPEGSSTVTVKNQNGGQLHLEKLIEGVYQYKVSAEIPTAYGETFVNITVLPAKRINKPPNIIITPANQTIKQPNSAAVLDASSSTDDDGIVSWHWELQQGPVGYQPQLKDSPTLQLNDLTKAGNYTFKLTVVDTDKAQSSRTANITVLKFTDYPPEANAGEDKIIYLPRNSITLSGNLSTDDHNITTWEWTKSAGDEQKAVDMQDTHTPYLKLSNLEKGMYTFTLKVTDSANKSSTAQVHVFVKPPTNKPPIANAGHNVTISLPQTWAILDGLNSTDDNKIVAFKWQQILGPSTVVFENVNASRTNVTGLTKGTYLFKLNVTDDNNNLDMATTYVIVNQNVNQPPVAVAGEDFKVELPLNAIILNGSNSHDDWAVVKWKWTRHDKSLAIGNIVENSDESPILIVTNVVVGKYTFNLTVFDAQGLSDTDMITVKVENDPKMFYLVELVLDVEVNFLSEEQYNMFKRKLALLIIDGTKLQMRNLRPQHGTNKAMVTFYVEQPDGHAVDANTVVQHLRQKLAVDANILGFTISKMQTAICQNNCSGHGVCDEVTRICECETFWMHNIFKLYFYPREDSDCSWSLLYVVLGAVCSLIGIIVCFCTSIYVCYSWCTRRNSRKTASYNLIENTEDLPPFASRKHSLTDSDTDSDVVFESRSKPLRKPTRNGLGKHIRRGLKA